MGLRWTCGAKGGSKISGRFLTVLFNLATVGAEFAAPSKSALFSCFFARFEAPKQILPAISVSLVLHSLFTQEPLFTIYVRVLSMPLQVAAYLAREDDFEVLDCILASCNELLSTICMAFLLLEVNAALGKQAKATMDLQKLSLKEMYMAFKRPF